MKKLYESALSRLETDIEHYGKLLSYQDDTYWKWYYRETLIRTIFRKNRVIKRLNMRK